MHIQCWVCHGTQQIYQVCFYFAISQKIYSSKLDYKADERDTIALEPRFEQHKGYRLSNKSKSFASNLSDNTMSYMTL